MKIFIRTCEARRILNISRQRLNQLIKNDIIKAIKIDGHIYYDYECVLAYKYSPKNVGGRPKNENE